MRIELYSRSQHGQREIHRDLRDQRGARPAPGAHQDDKLLAALGKFSTQITACTGTATIPANELDINLATNLVYLIRNP
jgi:hypothetical protein